MSEEHYFLPAEWQRQRCVQVGWPDAESDWRAYLPAIRQTMTALIAAITLRDEDVVVAARDVLSAQTLLRASLSAAQWQHVAIVACAMDDTWARDYGGIALLSSVTDDVRILDFRFNGWGNKYPSSRDNTITRQLHACGVLTGHLVDNNDFILEGGSIESDGQGTLFTTARCLLSPQRNALLTEREIEEQLCRRLHARRVLWLRHGALLGDDTDGHIDTLVRVCPHDTLLYVTAPAGDAHHAALSAMEDELRLWRTADGKPYTLVPLPLPAPVYFDGERLPATYANFLIINGAVIMPTYQQSDHDSEALRLLRSVFPDREVVPLDATVAIRQHGSLHCLTMQYPLPNDNNQ